MNPPILGVLYRGTLPPQNDKVTTRKKAADKLSDLLQNPTIITILCNQTVLSDNTNNRNTKNSTNDFTWNNLYRATYRYMLKEAEKLQKDKIKTAREALPSQSQG